LAKIQMHIKYHHCSTGNKRANQVHEMQLMKSQTL